MSLRKIISLLLLVAFTFTTVSPAFATTTLSLSPSTLPTLAEDDGTVASLGANIDVVPVGIRITATAQTDVVFCGDSNLLLTDDDVNGQHLLTDGNGKLLIESNNGGAADFAASRCVAGFAAPAGTKFVKLTADAYTDAATNNGTIYTGDNGGAYFRNVTVSNTALLPGLGVNGDAIVATVLDQAANSELFGNNATSLPAGSIVVSFITPTSAATGVDLGADGTLNITLTGIGLASDGNGTLADSGTLSATYIAPDAASQTNGQAALPNLTHATTFNIATLGATGDKLEVIKVGTKTGNDGSTVVVEPDAQPNTLLASLVTGSTVKVGPGEITSGGASSFLDTDAIIIRAKERPDSTSTTVTYYQTPFETSKFVTASALSNSGTNADTLQTTSVSDSAAFPNQDALITVTFALESAAGGASTATLAVDAVNVTLHGPRAFNSIRGAGATAGGQTTTTVTTPRGYLGAAINLENGTTSGYNNYVAMVLYNGDSTIGNYDVADVAVLDQDALAARHGQTIAALYTANFDSATAIHNGTTALGIFPGSLVTNGTVATTGTYNLVNVANGTAGATDVYSASYASTTGLTTAALLATPTELTARLLNGTSGASIGNTAYFILSGNDAGNSLTTAGLIKVGATNPGASAYETGFTAQATAAGVPLNNLIAAAELEGATLKIMPVINKYDSFRDALAIRPEATITVDAAALAAGVNLVATISGNNIASETKITLGTLLAAGTLSPTIDLTASALPVHGDMSSDNDLMAESATDAGASRAALDISTVTGAATTADSLADQLATGSVLDTTTPPLFCGGTAGTTTRGPNGLVIQPKARAILLTENGGSGFDDIQGLGANAVIRYTLPAGWDLNTFNADTASSQILGLETSGGLSASISRVQGIASGTTTAFVDVGSVTSSTVTVSSFNRLLGLFFKPHALLVPADTTDFSVTVDIVDTKGTSATTDDVVAGSLGTVALATECSTFLTVAFCPDALSTFNDTSITTPVASNVETTKVTRGARQTTFASSVGPALRLVEGTPEVITLPDLCITEGVADAFPLGSESSAGSTGVPTVFGDVTATNVTVHIATSFAGDSTDSAQLNVGINGAPAAASILFSDDSIQSDTAVTRVSGNEVYFEIDTRVLTGNELPFEETTRIRVPGLQLSAPSSAKTISAQDLIVWVEAGTAGSTSATAIVGSSLARSLSEVTASTDEYFLNPFGTASTYGKKMRNNFASKTQDDSTTSVPTDINWADNVVGGDNNGTVALAGGNPATLSNATRSEVDSATGYLELSGDTKISVLTSAITGVTSAVNAQVSVAPGTLEPGSLIVVDGTVDDVTVPVLADGSFQANIRCTAGTAINLTQTPESAAVTTPAIASATCDDVNVEPILLSATFVDSGLGTLTSRGTAPVVFQVTASGKLDGVDFVPTADQLTLGGNSVTAVAGTTDKFIGIVNFNKSSGKEVATTAGDGSTVTLTLGTNSTPPSISGGVPTLRKAKLNKKGTKVVLRGLRLGNNGVAHFILDDGTASAIDLVNRNSKDAQIGRRRGEVGSSIPANAEYAVFHNAGRGMSALEL